MTTSPASEHRGETRLALEQSIFIERLGQGSESAIILCSSLDMSSHGIKIIVDQAIPPGSILRICIDFPQQDPIYLVGEVKWQSAVPEEEAYQLGFQLFDSEDTNFQQWHHWVDTMLDFGSY